MLETDFRIKSEYQIFVSCKEWTQKKKNNVNIMVANYHDTKVKIIIFTTIVSSAKKLS